jgi:hypothetical protein
MTLTEVINRVCPSERGVVKACIMPHGVHTDILDEFPKVVSILREHNVQETVSVNANGHNPIIVNFDKYVLDRPNHGCHSWGRHYEALLALCAAGYTIWLWDDKDYGFELAADGSVSHTWQADPG